MSAGTLLRRGGFRTLLVGQGVSALGDWMGTFAFMALAYRQSGSPTAVGGILALRLLPAAVGGPLAARAASRWDRRRTMVAMDLVRAGMIAAVPFVGALWWIYLWAFLVEVCSLVFLPARDASIPDLVPDTDLELANGFVLGSSYGTIPLGAAVFALLAAMPAADIFGLPLALVFWLDGASFVISAVLIGRLTTLAGVKSGDGGSIASTPRVRFRDAFRIPLIRAVGPATVAVALGLGALFSLGIEFVRKVLGASDAQFGVLVALFGVGAAFGLLLMQRVRLTDRLRATQIGVAALGIIVATFSLAPSIWFAFLGALLFGAAVAWTLASGMGTLQSELEGQDRILAFAVFHIAIRSGLAAAAIGAGVAGDLAGAVDWPLVGTLEPSRLVLLCSGLLVLASAVRVRRKVVGGRRVTAERAQPEGA